jgi:hypothetical protein
MLSEDVPSVQITEEVKPAAPIRFAPVVKKTKIPVLGSSSVQEDEEAPEREMILLEFTEDELKEFEAIAAKGDLEVDEDKSESELLRKQQELNNLLSKLGQSMNGGNSSAVGITESIQARVLAKAQAISASLAKKQANALPDTAPAQKNAAKAADTVDMKKIADSLPQDKYVLLVSVDLPFQFI